MKKVFIMGRTLPTSTMLIQEFEESWRPYARALRKEDREVLGELFAMVRFQSAAIAYASRPDPFQVFALAMLGGMMKRVMHLETVAEREEVGSEGEGASSERREAGGRGREAGGGERETGSESYTLPLPESFNLADGHPSERDWGRAGE